MAFQLCKLFSRNKYSGRGFSTFRLSNNHLAYNDWVIFNCNEGRGQISLARSENCVRPGGGWTQWPEGGRRPRGEGPRVTAPGGAPAGLGDGVGVCGACAQTCSRTWKPEVARFGKGGEGTKVCRRKDGGMDGGGRVQLPTAWSGES